MVDLGPARVSEAPLLGELSRDLIEDGLSWRWRAGPIRTLIFDASTEVVVAREGGDVLGFAAMSLGRDRAHVVLLAVRPEARRAGIGSRLLGYLLALARAAMIEEIVLEVRATNEAARGFYASLGFREVALVRGYYDGREAAVRMSLAVDGAS